MNKKYYCRGTLSKVVFAFNNTFILDEHTFVYYIHKLNKVMPVTNYISLAVLKGI